MLGLAKLVMALLLTFHPRKPGSRLAVAAAGGGTGSAGRQQLVQCEQKHQLLVHALAASGTPGSALPGSPFNHCPSSVLSSSCPLLVTTKEVLSGLLA